MYKNPLRSELDMENPGSHLRILIQEAGGGTQESDFFFFFFFFFWLRWVFVAARGLSLVAVSWG